MRRLPAIAQEEVGPVDGQVQSVEARWAEIFEQHHLRLYRLALLWTSDATVSEDVVAEAFLRLYPPWVAGEVRDVGAYLRSSVVNNANGDHRRRNRADALVARLARPAPLHDVDVSVGIALRDAIAELPSALRGVVVLRYFEDLSVDETAALLRVPPGTVKSRTARALDRLRPLLEDRHD
jgi:RNA polymerase sigma factor (sigma-70 family)